MEAAPPVEAAPREDMLVSRVSRYRDLTPQQKRRLSDWMRSQELGIAVSASPLQCKGAECPFSALCPLIQIQAAPEGGLCPVEDAIMLRLREKLLTSLGINPEDVETDAFDAGLVDDLVTLTMLERRLLMEIGKDPQISLKVPSAVVNNVVFNTYIADPRYRVLESFQKQKLKLQQELLGTRRSRVQAGGSLEDASRRAATLMERMRKASRDAQPVVIDAEFTQVEEPDGE